MDAALSPDKLASKQPISAPVSRHDYNETHADSSETQEASRAQRGGDSEADNNDGYSTTSFSDDDGVRRASRLTTDELLQAYIQRLDRYRDSSGPSGKRRRGNLVESLVYYMHGLESRITDLESKLGSKTESEDDRNRFIPADTELTVRFFRLDDEVLLDGQFRNQEKIGNTFRSINAPRHFIRVLYRWKTHVPVPQKIYDNPPDPSDIEVVGIRIDSRPLYTFYARSLALAYGGQFPVLEFYRPYRAIIHSLKELQEHIADLESPRPTSNNPTNEEHVEQQEDDSQSGSKEDATQTTENVMHKPTLGLTSLGTATALSHFRGFMDLVQKYLEQPLSIYKTIQAGSCSRVSFEDLWMLFNRDETIYCPGKRARQELTQRLAGKTTKTYTGNTDWPQAFRVYECHGGLGIGPAPMSQFHDYLHTPQSHQNAIQDQSYEGTRESFTQLVVYCFTVRFNGQKYGPTTDFFIFKPFDGEIDITDLEAYPIRFYAQKESIVQRLLERGRKFIDISTVSHMNYDGLSVGDTKEGILSSVMVDTKLAFQENVRQPPKFNSILFRGGFLISSSNQTLEVAIGKPCEHRFPCYRWACMYDAYVEARGVADLSAFLKRNLNDYEPKEKVSKLIREEMKRHMEAKNLLILLPGDVPAYALRNRKWFDADVELLEPVVHDAGWNDLVLPSGHKEIIRAMVENHAVGASASKDGLDLRTEVDLVRGKGKGCIILIHGAPGVGKTSTAECVAAYTNRPLLPITCGDIGYKPEMVEDSLDKLFTLAHKWGCVLLLDEADVFLAKRNKEDIKRNGLVSIFLRTLEYYSGILFLTTNRVGAIDDAFRSRLHLTLYYPPLDREKTGKVWKVNIRRLKGLNEDREKLGRPRILIDKKKLLQYADLNFEELHWNGRQIRNAFQSALALADFKVRDTPGKSPEISMEQFHTIATASREFDRYLHVTHGADEDKIAQQDKMRGAYKQTDLKKLQLVPSSDESDSSSDSRHHHNSDASESSTESDDPVSKSKRSTRRKTRGKSKKRLSKKEQKREESQGRKRKGKGKEKTKKKKKEEEEEEARDSNSGSDSGSDSDTED
ncbi:hypothetical protein F4809DRAFT_623386 [Biscogniauxia mediterranea]|nr:hypothetical protein F4809DRAFT_623386 [Biscogniauxia mediterranea]